MSHDKCSSDLFRQEICILSTLWGLLAYKSASIWREKANLCSYAQSQLTSTRSNLYASVLLDHSMLDWREARSGKREAGSTVVLLYVTVEENRTRGSEEGQRKEDTSLGRESSDAVRKSAVPSTCFFSYHHTGAQNSHSLYSVNHRAHLLINTTGILLWIQHRLG